MYRLLHSHITPFIHDLALAVNLTLVDSPAPVVVVLAAVAVNLALLDLLAPVAVALAAVVVNVALGDLLAPVLSVVLVVELLPQFLLLLLRISNFD